MFLQTMCLNRRMPDEKEFLEAIRTELPPGCPPDVFYGAIHDLIESRPEFHDLPEVQTLLVLTN
jgi:hypothetical protein